MSVHPSIPGPKGKFLLGNILDFAQDPPEFFLSLARRYGDVVSFRLGRRPFLLVSHPDLVEEVLIRHGRSFEKVERDREIMGRALGNGLVTSTGDFHRRQRGLSQPAFRKKRIRLFADGMLEETEGLLGRWREGEVVDVAKEMTLLTMYIVARTLFQVEVEEAAEIGEAVHQMQRQVDHAFRSPILWPTWFPTPHNIRAKRAYAQVDGFVRKMIRRRRKEGALEERGDLLSSLILARDDEGNPMSEEQLRDELVTLFVAGHETTSNALSWTWMLLSKHPEVEARLHEELDRVLGSRPVTPEDVEHLPYAAMVLKESMRLYPPAWTLNARTAMEDVEIQGHRLARGSNVFIAPYVLHRDPRFYHAPEAFDPEHFAPEREKQRPRCAYIPFGVGPRVCIGNAYAMTEAILVLARVAQRYRLRLDPEYRWRKEALITMGPEGPVPMRLEARVPGACASPRRPAQEPRPRASGCPFHAAS